MELLERIGRLTAAPGATGMEEAVAAEVMAQLADFGAEAWQDKAGSVFARTGAGRPVVLLMAHMDEVGMLVHTVEENGMLRLCKIAGVDPRILPGSRLVIQGREGPIWAVAGALPPHLKQEGEPPAYTWEDILCDTGLPPAEAKRLVRPGDMVTLAPEPPVALLGSRAAGKTLDDRAPLAAMLALFGSLCKETLPCTVVLCASVQEEKSGAGAMAGAYAICPDMAIAVDVCHAPPPDTPFRTYPLEDVILCRSASLHQGLFGLLEDAAKAAGISYQVEASMAASGTDAWDMAVQAGGVATGLLSVPLRYMHTGVEVVDLGTLAELEKLLACFLRGLGGAWEETLCWND
ncbi:MAG: M20/M25/M40 family metallo-hydrolase [Candidatus Pelethousia sp.]|nr:M20/M25/M40 family metallo-hydrolase [Candidatus Pelethousia sp.]